MALQERVSTSAARAAYRGVKRACYAGYDSVTLRREVVRRVAPALGAEATVFTTTDPDTGLATHTVGEHVDRDMVRHYYEVVYPSREAARTMALARAGPGVTSLGAEPGAALGDFYSPEFREMVHQHGLASDMRVALTAHGQLWGIWGSMREAVSPPFNDGERSFIGALAPHLARGLASAALLQRADESGAGEEEEREGGRWSTVPGVLVIDPRRRVTLRNAPAAAHLADLADARPGGLPRGVESLAVPTAVGRVAEMLAARLARTSASEGGEPLSAELRVRGRSGRWYRLRASLTEPDGRGESATVVVVEPMTRGDVAPMLAPLYGLSAREREVLADVARGLTTSEIAARLGLPPTTVQQQLDRAFDKVGVRGRGALLAKLFVDGYAPWLMADEPARRPTAALAD